MCGAQRGAVPGRGAEVEGFGGTEESAGWIEGEEITAQHLGMYSIHYGCSRGERQLVKEGGKGLSVCGECVRERECM